MGLFNWLFRKKERQIKLGIALGSGGAKGFAELGALQALAENGITFDIVGGTSIGSIVGAFYADGYSPIDIVEMLKRIRPKEIKTGICIGMDMSRLESVIDRELGHKNIEELKKPFVCIATDMEKGDAKAFYDGKTATRLCASSSMQPYFKPVEIDGVKYVDGAYANSIPADKVREMGADYVVGVDLRTPQSKPSLLSRFIPSYKSDVAEPWAIGYANCDIMIHPDLTGYTSTSFAGAIPMYELGYAKAMQLIPTIKSDIEKLKTKKKRK